MLELEPEASTTVDVQARVDDCLIEAIARFSPKLHELRKVTQSLLVYLCNRVRWEHDLRMKCQCLSTEPSQNEVSESVDSTTINPVSAPVHIRISGNLIPEVSLFMLYLLISQR